MGAYTYLVGLAILGAIIGAVGLVAAERERKAHRNDKPAHADR